MNAVAAAAAASASPSARPSHIAVQAPSILTWKYNGDSIGPGHNAGDATYTCAALTIYRAVAVFSLVISMVKC